MLKKDIHKMIYKPGFFQVTILALIIVGILLCIIPAPRIFTDAASDVGDIIGTTIGGIEGVVLDGEEAYRSGKAEGLSAKDTKVEQIQNSCRRIGKLEVLYVETEIESLMTIGKDFSKLSLVPVKGYYYVDLGKAEVRINDDAQVEILVPDIEVDSSLDRLGEKELGKYQAGKYKGSTIDGYMAMMNSDKELIKKASEALVNNSELMQQARENANRSIGYLSRTLSLEDPDVVVEFCREHGE